MKIDIESNTLNTTDLPNSSTLASCATKPEYYAGAIGHTYYKTL